MKTMQITFLHYLSMLEYNIYSFKILIFLHIGKFGILRQPYKLNRSDRAVSLLGYDHLCNVALFCIFVVIIITI